MLPDPLAPEFNTLALASFAVKPAEARSLLSRLAKLDASTALSWGQRPVRQSLCKVLTVDPHRVALWCAQEIAHLAGVGDGMVVALMDRYRVQFRARRMRHLDPPDVPFAVPAKGTLMVCEFPADIWRINRRDTFRSRTGRNADALLLIAGPDGTVTSAALFDLSLGGLSFSLPADDPLAPTLQSGMRLDHCRISCGGLRTVPFSMALRHVAAPDAQTTALRAGAAFLGVGADLTRDVQLAMYHLEAAKNGR